MGKAGTSADKSLIILVAEDKAGTWNSNKGHITQIFGESLCCTHNTRRKEVLRVVSMSNHYMAFFTLRATKELVDAVCNHKQLPPGFAKMIMQKRAYLSISLTSSNATQRSCAWRRYARSCTRAEGTDYEPKKTTVGNSFKEICMHSV